MELASMVFLQKLVVFNAFTSRINWEPLPWDLRQGAEGNDKDGVDTDDLKTWFLEKQRK